MVWVSHPFWQGFDLVDVFEIKVEKQTIAFNIRKIHVFCFDINFSLVFFYDCKIFQYYKSDMIILIENLFSKQFLSEPALPQCKCRSRDVLIKSILTCPDPVKGQFILHIINSNNMISN